MPIKKSAKKELRKSLKNHKRNKSIKDALKEKIKATRKAIIAKKADEAKKLLQDVVKMADKAAQRKKIKKNKPARQK